MTITKTNVHRHELIGLNAKVIKARNPANVGIAGKIIDETQKSLVIRDKIPKRVFKEGTRFEVTLPNMEKVEIDGTTIAVRPWERIKLK